MTLRPNETVQKVLFSSTSRLVGEYEQDSILITHAWPDFYNKSLLVRMSEGPASRSAYIFAVKTAHVEKKPGVRLPEYSPMGDLICSYLSVLYGKRFDSHGLLEGSGFFHVPELSQFTHLCDHHLPQNSHVSRPDFSVPLNLTEFSRIDGLLLNDGLDQKFLRTFQGASKFYLQALQNAEHDPEVAYLHLITSGEILSNFQKYSKEDLLDQETKKALESIKKGAPNGSKLAGIIAGKLLLVKKRFTETIIRFIDDSFFRRSESNNKFGCLKAESFRDSISAAYDLRSVYIHTGVPFGSWVSMGSGGRNDEVQFGKPVVEDSKLGDILDKAPTYIGLERVIRYCLLKFAIENGAYTDAVSVEANT